MMPTRPVKQGLDVISERTDSPRPTCTVVVCTRNRPKDLDLCLEAVARLDYPRFDVLVIDNAPKDNQSRQVAMRWGAEYAIEPIAGLSRARNRGAAEATGEIIAYLDDDSIPEPGWLSALAREFEDPMVMSVTGRIVGLSVETEAERLWAQIGVSSNGHGRHAVDSSIPIWFELANFGGIGDGGNMAFRRDVFREWSGFDERLGCGAGLGACEEHNAFFQLIDRGFRIIYTPRAVVRHPYPQSLEDLHARQRNALAASTGYFTLLFFEEPRYRKEITKYVLEALRGTPRAWRGPASARRPRVLSRLRTGLACLSGPIRYFRIRFAQGRPSRVPILSARAATRNEGVPSEPVPASSSAARSSSTEW